MDYALAPTAPTSGTTTTLGEARALRRINSQASSSGASNDLFFPSAPAPQSRAAFTPAVF
jgi:hypothetical protein